MTALELLENQACEAIAQAVACEHSPAVPGSHEAAAIHAAEDIAARIRARQARELKLLGFPVKLDRTIPPGTVWLQDDAGVRYFIGAIEEP